MKSVFKLLVLLIGVNVLFLFAPTPSYAASPEECSALQTKLLGELSTTPGIDILRYCPGGTQNDAYYDSCFSTYFQFVQVNNSISLSCDPTQQAIMEARLRSEIETRVIAYINEVGNEDPTRVLTPRPETTPSGGPDSNSDFEDALEVASGGCGGLNPDGSDGMRCCVPSVNTPPVPVPYPEELPGFLVGMIDIFRGWFKGPEEDLQNMVFQAGQGRLCTGVLEPEVRKSDGTRVPVKLVYDLEQDGYWAQNSCAEESNGACTSEREGEFIQAGANISCSCINPDAAVGTGPEDFVGGAGLWVETSREICDSLDDSEKKTTCSDCLSRNEVYNTVTNRCQAKSSVDTQACSTVSADKKDTCIQCYYAGRNWGAEGCSTIAFDTGRIEGLCKNVGGGQASASDADGEYNKCISCAQTGKLWTAIGCVDLKLDSFIQNQILGIGLGLAGLTAFLCIIYSAFIFQTSSNNPEKITQAQDMMTSCITGLIVIIFSIFILNVIGVNLLRIPGFSQTTPTPTPPAATATP